MSPQEKKQQKLWTSYEGRMERVIHYIHDHLDEDLDLMTLADVACMSHYHWHRIYIAMRGETAAQTVKRLRLARAARDLAETDLTITAIAKRSGYPNIQSFSRTFAETYGAPPAKYRKSGNHAPFQTALREGMNEMFEVEIKTSEGFTLNGMPHRGDYMNVGRAFERIFGTLMAKGLADKMGYMAGVYYDDPDSVKTEDLRSFAGALLEGDVVVGEPLETLDVPGGRVAVLHYKGPYGAMMAAYHWLYGTWLPKSGEDVRDAPPYEIYLNSPEETAPQDLLTDIHIPLK